MTKNTMTSLAFTCPKCGRRALNLYSDREFIELGHARRLLDLNALYCDECEAIESKKLERGYMNDAGQDHVR